jgi:uncharacterized protein (DUF362 family)
MPTPGEGSSRRRFLGQILRTAALAAGTTALGFAFWERRGPDPGEDEAAVVRLPDFSQRQSGGILAVARGDDRSANLSAAIQALGGIQTFIKHGDRVLIKVNAAFATPPVLGATTHPACVGRLVELCFQAGAGSVAVTDNPINDPASCFELSGIAPAARKAGARVILPAADLFEPYTLAGGQLIRRWPVLGKPLNQVDKVIGMAPVKDHHRSGASMTLKNWYGLLGGRRNIFHQQIHTIIAELAMMIRPTLVILDGTRTMVSNGPTGGSLADLKSTRTLIAGTDPVAVDTVGAALLGKTPADLPHLLMAEKAGAGTTDYKALRMVEVNA